MPIREPNQAYPSLGPGRQAFLCRRGVGGGAIRQYGRICPIRFATGTTAPVDAFTRQPTRYPVRLPSPSMPSAGAANPAAVSPVIRAAPCPGRVSAGAVTTAAARPTRQARTSGPLSVSAPPFSFARSVGASRCPCGRAASNSVASSEGPALYRICDISCHAGATPVNNAMRSGNRPADRRVPALGFTDLRARTNSPLAHHAALQRPVRAAWRDARILAIKARR